LKQGPVRAPSPEGRKHGPERGGGPQGAKGPLTSPLNGYLEILYRTVQDQCAWLPNHFGMVMEWN